MRKRIIHSVYVLVCCLLCSCPSEPPVPEPPDTLRCIDIQCSTPYEEVGREETKCIINLQDGRNEITTEGKIHLRGHSTAECPKRPFLMKLASEMPIFGMPSAKSWVLLANYFDSTMLRNALAFHMAEDSRLDWTPRSRFTELYYNLTDEGIYQVCEKIQVHPNRLNLSADGWLVEIDMRHSDEKDRWFITPHMEQPICFRYPESATFTSQDSSVIRFFSEADSVLFSATFADFIEGWRHYLDEPSWIDWYLINEIAKNNDAIFFSSCYMHSGEDGKIVMGPVWDFDLAFGNSAFNDTDKPQGWHVRTENWYARLFEDPAFAAAVKERFEWFYDHQDDYYRFLRSSAENLQPHVQNENVETLIQWLEERINWMKNNL